MRWPWQEGERVVEVPCKVHGVADYIASVKGNFRELTAMDMQERRDYVADAARVTESDAFKNEVKFMVNEQVYYMAEHSDLLSPEQQSFLRGTINGLRLLPERLDLLAKEYQDSLKPKEEFDPYSVL